MCCTLEPAKLSNTILYAAETVHNGKLVHVMGYQNRAENLARGPNAMILPIPTDVALGPENTVDMRAAKHVLADYAEALTPRTRSLSKGFGHDGLDDDSRGVQVFESGSYTVVLAKNAADIPSAVKHVPVNKRPSRINTAVFEAYSKWYPGWPVALCCFDGAVEAEPMLWWYEPRNASSLFLPALDAHDGNPPDLSARVGVDHTVAVGSVSAPRGSNVHFRDFPRYSREDGSVGGQIPDNLRPFLATKVTGKKFGEGTRLQNGDFSIPLTRVAAGEGNAISRVLPPGA